jgi:hypothetical protein
MPRKITCGDCQTTYTLADAVKSKTLRCKKCGASLEVPTATAAEAPVAMAPEKRSARERVTARRPKGVPIHRQPIFYVCILATLVCGYFAVKYQ